MGVTPGEHRLVDPEALPHRGQRVLVKRDFQRLNLGTIAVPGQTEWLHPPSHRDNGGHAVNFSDHRVASNAIEQRELDMGQGQILAQSHHLGSPQPKWRNRETGRLPDIRGFDRTVLAKIGENRIEHMRAGRRVEPDRCKVSVILVPAGDQVHGIVRVELIDFEPASGRAQMPAQLVDKDSFAIMMHLDKMPAERKTGVGVDDLDLHFDSPFQVGFHQMSHLAAIEVVTGMLFPRVACEAARSIVMFATALREERVTPPRWQAPITAGLVHPTSAKLRHIGGRRGLPIVGAMPEILLDPMGFSRRMAARHGRLYRFHAFGAWHLHALGPEAHEIILFDADNAFSAAEGWGPLVRALLPGALLIRDGPEHRVRRRLLGEAFKQADLAGYQRIFAADIEQRCSTWLGREVEVFREAKRLSFDIASSTFLGMALGRESDRALGWFARVAGGLLAVSANPQISRARSRALAGKANLERLVARLIEEKRRVGGEDFLARMSHQLDDEGRQLPVGQIVDTFIFLLVAAHDTMSSALTSCVFFLAANPLWASLLRDELRQAGVDCAADAASAKLPLQDMFYKEAIRLNPPAPIVWRRATRNVAIYGCEIPAGTMTGINLMVSHRLPDIWPEPDRFDPMRFATDAERARHRFAYVPFGAGIHKCLGMHFSQQQARTLMTYLLLNAELCLVRDIWPRWYNWPSCRPRGRFAVAVNPRSRGR